MRPSKPERSIAARRRACRLLAGWLIPALAIIGCQVVLNPQGEDPATTDETNAADDLVGESTAESPGVDGNAAQDPIGDQGIITDDPGASPGNSPVTQEPAEPAPTSRAADAGFPVDGGVAAEVSGFDAGAPFTDGGYLEGDE